MLDVMAWAAASGGLNQISFVISDGHAVDVTWPRSRRLFDAQHKIYAKQRDQLLGVESKAAAPKQSKAAEAVAANFPGLTVRRIP